MFKSLVTLIKDSVRWFLAKIPTSLGVRTRRFFYRRLFAKIGTHARFMEDITVLGFKNIRIGDDLLINKFSFLEAENGKLEIGRHARINTNVHIDATDGQILIGDDCLIGPNCVLRAADHAFARTDEPIRKQGHTSGKIILEDDVWLGSNVVITRGVQIGRGSVIGALSVVTHDIPSYSVAVGNPARVIRSRLRSEMRDEPAVSPAL